GSHHEVNVVGHQHVRVHGHIVQLAGLGYRCEKQFVVVRRAKDVRLVVAALDDVLGQSDDTGAKETSHAAAYAQVVCDTNVQRSGRIRIPLRAKHAETEIDRESRIAVLATLSRIVTGV